MSDESEAEEGSQYRSDYGSSETGSITTVPDSLQLCCDESVCVCVCDESVCVCVCV